MRLSFDMATLLVLGSRERSFTVSKVQKVYFFLSVFELIDEKS